MTGGAVWYGVDGLPITLEEADALLADPLRRRVGLTRVGMWEVSTVFLVLDHGWGTSPRLPVLWETMLFCHDSDSGARNFMDLDQRRYTSRADAERGHEEMVAQLVQALGELHEPTEREDVTNGDH